MSFTNQALGALGTATGALAAGEHIKQQKAANEAAIAEDKQIVDTTKTAIKNDTIEAATAIAAHEPEFKKILDEGKYDLTNLTDEQVDKLTQEVEAFRTGKMTEDRITNMKEAGERFDKYHDKKVDKIYKTGDQLKRAYERFRELNQRIDASRQLKFNLESAQARLKARGVK